MNPISQNVLKAVAGTLPGLSEPEAQTRRRLLQTFQTFGLDADRDALNRIAGILNSAGPEAGNVATMRSHADLLIHIANSRPVTRCAGCAA